MGICEIMSKLALCVIVLPLLAASGCATVDHRDIPKSYAVTSAEGIVPPASNGSIYQEGRMVGLFTDIRAARVGDIVTIVLEEKMNASKKATTSTSKSGSASMSVPVLMGDAATGKSFPMFGANLDSAQDFSGDGSSSQSNNLNGTVTATVTRVLPNGNMVIEGEKWLTLNQGQEYIRLSGVIRPSDVMPDNSVMSTLIADARIEYAGKGMVADSNKAGWLSRFFMNPIFPF